MKSCKINGMHPLLWIGCCIIIIASVYLDVLPGDMVGAVAACFGFGSIIVFLGDRIPIWNTYLGGGVLLCMFGGSALRYFHLLPERTVETLSNFIGPWGWMNTFIIFVIVGSVLSVSRKVLLNSIARYIPCILAACLGAALVATIIGALFGKTPGETLAFYVLPIMSGGSGAGALPLAQMFSEMTGADFDHYITIAMATLTLGDLFAVISASILAKLTSGNPRINGNGKLMKSGKSHQQTADKAFSVPEMKDLVHCLIIVFAVYMLSVIFSTKLLPSIAGAQLHMFAYAVIFSVILKLTNVLPENLVSALVYSQKYMISAFVVVQMFCCGVAYTDLATLISCFASPATVLICLGVILGAILGGGLLGHLVGFYPYESAITSGLCMANAGGSGDVALLSSVKRMNLMPYAQISSRIGNAIILILESFIFAILF